MGIKSALSKPFASIIAHSIHKWSNKPIETQEKGFWNLINTGKQTLFGKDHQFEKIQSYDDFKKFVPIRDYEGHKPYIEKIIAGEKNVLWKDAPLYFCKTSGTTSGAKYIPITKESIPHHINAARNAILMYIFRTGKTGFINGKMIFLSGSPELSKIGNIHLGRLSGIVNHHVPQYLKKNQMPSYQVNCIEDWETKVDAIAEETRKEDMTLISGIPSWVQMYFDKLLQKTGKKTIREIFPDFSLFIYGGVQFEPYRGKFEKTIGGKIDSIELYPASEGFIAYQDAEREKGLLLLLDSGMFYEFIPSNEFYNSNPTRLALKDIELGVNYAIILNTNAGLWGYSIGDTVKFVSKNPYRLEVTGRISHYTSAFGEHIIAEEVEAAMVEVSRKNNIEVSEFTLAPQVNPKEGLPYHEWFIEFSQEYDSLETFRYDLDQAMQKRNIYYRDLIKGNVLQPLIIKKLQKNAFIEYMKSEGKLGGQNKIPRLSNDRKIADALTKYVVS
jgi:hypothetical protein